jgi:hypothetical protein
MCLQLDSSGVFVVGLAPQCARNSPCQAAVYQSMLVSSVLKCWLLSENLPLAAHQSTKAGKIHMVLRVKCCHDLCRMSQEAGYLARS